jgi:MFS transporter, AAHS family, 4-hydroxybenzoate transporter
MTTPAPFNVEAVVDAQRPSAFNIGLFVLGFLVMVVDGFDLQAAAFAAPALTKAWGISRPDLAPVFSASLVGVLAGAPLFGWVGDRFGRRTAIVIGLVIMGLASLACSQAQSIGQLMALRFVVGLGLGAALPNNVALAAELAPKAIRGMVVTMTTMGISLGAALPGFAAAALVPTYGWQSLFVLGGAAPLVAAAVVALAMPESPSFLVLRGRPREKIEALLRRMDRSLVIPPDATLVLHPRPEARASLGELFRGKLALGTPLLWTMFIATMLTNYLLTSWLPLLLGDSGLSPDKAASATSYFHLGGAVGGIAAALLLDRYGLKVLAVLFAGACVAVLFLSQRGLPLDALTIGIAAAGFCIISAQGVNNAAASLVYPPNVRASGVGWALGVGRFGGIAGPLIGGALAAQALSPHSFFLAALGPLAVGLLATLLLMRHFKGKLAEP